MAEENKSFSDLLSEAPLAANEDTVSLVGALARSNQPGKFVLALSQGNSVTLDVGAVKAHRVIGGGVGQLLVQVDLDRAQVPDAVRETASPAGLPVTGFRDIKHPILDKPPWEEPVKTHPETDQWFGAATSAGLPATGFHDIKHPSLDKPPWEEPVKTHPETDVAASAATPAGLPFTGFRDIKHPILDKPPWEEPVRTNPEIDLAPFALATPQQAPAESLSAMQAAPVANSRTFFTWDINTGFWDNYKRPILDATGRPPYLD